MPKGYDKAKPSPIVVALHHSGRLEDLFGDAGQDMADRIGVPFVCVSGSYRSGPRIFSWMHAVNPSAEAKRIDAALAALAHRITVAPGKLVIVGLGAGAQVGVEIAVRDPDRYAGAVAIAPIETTFGLDSVKPDLRERRFVIVAGPEASRKTEDLLASLDAEWLRGRGCATMLDSVPANRLPADFVLRVPNWVRFVLEGKE